MRSPGKVAGPRAQRAVQSILESARMLFLENGYVNTSVEDITKAAGVSRATFWTYFKSKPDVLRALGANAETAGTEVAARFAQISDKHAADEIRQWVGDYIEFLETYGGFIHATYQATLDDPELREWSMSTMMMGAQLFGGAIESLRGGPIEPPHDSAIEGLAFLSMMERVWYQWRIGGTHLERTAIVTTIANIIGAAVCS
ncbi:MAG: TetR/AcrR family transcriptional regulator [Aeromicrobium sp.]